MSQKKIGTRRRLSLTEADFGKLMSIVNTAKKYLSDRGYIDVLEEKLENAVVVSRDKVPSDVVEIDRSVQITDLDRSEQKLYKLVYPREANYGNHISVAAPLGSALLGCRVGEVVEVRAPGRTRRVRVDAIGQSDDIAA